MKNKFVIIILFLLIAKNLVFGAVGCSLNDPDRDIKWFFPGSTGYKTEYISIKERGGEKLAKEVEKKLRDSLDSKYEALDIPYSYYTVLKGKEIIGRVHGLNQKGMFGGMQLILATDLDGEIIGFYYQKLTSPDAKKFKKKEFTNQFIGLTLADLYDFQKNISNNKISKIKSPSEKYYEDFLNTLRGIHKNLILLDIFHLERKYDEIYKEEGEKHNEKDSVRINANFGLRNNSDD